VKKLIASLRSFLIHRPIFVKLCTRCLDIMLLSTIQSAESLCAKDCTFVMGVNENA
jgi:hypothetical protein